MKTGERLKRLRKEQGLSADELGAMIGKDRSTIYRYERGDIETAPVDVIVSLAQALKIPPPYLLGWDQHPVSWLSPEIYEGVRAQAEQLFQATDVFAWSDEEVAMFLDMAMFFVKIRATEEYDGHVAFLRTLFRHMTR